MRSLRHKIDQLAEIAYNLQLDVFAITESWLDDTVASREVAIPHYRLFPLDRNKSTTATSDMPTSSGHGRVCLYVQDYLDVTQIPSIQHLGLELLAAQLRAPKHHCGYTVVCVYRPPSSTTHIFGRCSTHLLRALSQRKLLLLLVIITST